MGTRYPRTLSMSMAMLLFCAFICSACAASGSASAKVTTATPEPPTPLPTVSSAMVQSACPDVGYFSSNSVQVGDLYIGVDLSNTSYPDLKLPDGIPDAPYTLPGTSDVGLTL